MGSQEHRVERRLAAIFAADVAGYSRLMSQDGVGTLQILTAHREIMDRLIAEHGGRIANTAGDSVLAEFPSAVDAVQCAVAVQKALTSINGNKPEAERLQFRIGVHVGDTIAHGSDLLGDGVNIAARLESIAEPGGICISASTHEHVRKALPLAYTDLGPQQVKNFNEPIWAFAVPLVSTSSTAAQRAAPLPSPDKASIAVLPFINMSSDPEQEYFADGVAEDIITALSRVRWLFVIARNSSFTYKGRAVDVKQVGRELGVRYILNGSVRRAGEQLRITGQLIDATTGRHVWADRFDGNLEDLFDLQDRITVSIVGAVEPSVQRLEIERAKAKPTESLSAYDLYLRALPLHYSATQQGLTEAQTLLARALALDPSFSLAKGFAALTAVIQKNQGWIEDGNTALAGHLAREALADHRDDPMTLRCAGHALAYLDRDYDLAAPVLERALGLNPNSAQVRSSCGWVHNFIGDASTAFEHFTHAIRLSPLDPEIGHSLTGLSFAHLMLGQNEEALRTSEKAIAALPRSLSPYRAAIMALVELGRVEKAKELGRALLTLNPTFTIQSFRTVQPFRDQLFAERYLAALQASGVP